MKPPKFTLTFLYKRILTTIKQAEQWDWPDVAHNRAKYYNKAEALLNLLENLTVFHEGLGATPDSEDRFLLFNDRVESFKYLLKREQNDTSTS